MVSNEAVGLIEVLGLVAAVEAADAAIKSANVRLIGYELAKGGGWATVKVVGDVGAVKAAVDSGSAAASKVNKVISTIILARPHDDIDSIIYSPNNVYFEDEQEEVKGTDSEPLAFPTEDTKDDINEDTTENAETIPVKSEENSVSTSEAAPEDEPAEVTEEEVAGEPMAEETTPEEDEVKTDSPVTEFSESVKPTCNLCKDPACPRFKGDPRSACIHNKD